MHAISRMFLRGLGWAPNASNTRMAGWNDLPLDLRLRVARATGCVLDAARLVAADRCLRARQFMPGEGAMVARLDALLFSLGASKDLALWVGGQHMCVYSLWPRGKHAFVVEAGSESLPVGHLEVMHLARAFALYGLPVLQLREPGTPSVELTPPHYIVPVMGQRVSRVLSDMLYPPVPPRPGTRLHDPYPSAGGRAGNGEVQDGRQRRDVPGRQDTGVHFTGTSTSQTTAAIRSLSSATIDGRRNLRRRYPSNGTGCDASRPPRGACR